MPNTYFRFKQFTIHQDQCAMKVCTDACIFGAWFAEKIPSLSTVLDIGSGTGLLMLMLAQKNKAMIDGIEIDLPTYKQLRENIARSRWKSSLQAFPGDVRHFSFPNKYDVIISNPPFFEGDLLSPKEENNLAKHSSSLKLEELIGVIGQNLDPSGFFGILLPYHRMEAFEALAGAHQFYLQEKLLLRQSDQHPYFRSILQFSRNKSGFSTSSELSITYNGEGYTNEYVELMKDYYLHW
ncbi:MAG TPA: methyltransferase [Puia sp.]|nr:methyltransferase [Puia sp.]